jgi:hypothetical protein
MGQKALDRAEQRRSTTSHSVNPVHPLEGEVMRKSVIGVVTAIALVMALAGASSASAVQWSPQNVTRIGNSVGSVHWQGPGWSMNCTSLQMTGKTTGSSLAGSGQTAFWPSGCTGAGGGIPVTTAGNWSVNALSTTTASLSGDATASMTFTYSICKVTLQGPFNITGLQWSNTTHQLTLPKGTVFPVSLNSPACTFMTPLTLEGSIAFSNLTIVP